MRHRRLVATSFVLAAGCGALAGCAPSVSSLERAAAHRDGVVRVSVGGGGGEDQFLGTPARTVEIVMRGDATADEVLAVFGAYADDVASGDVEMVDVLLEGPRNATLSTGAGVQMTEPMVRDLIAAQADDRVATYRREAYPVADSVEITLDDADFVGVADVADRYRDVDDVTVASGRFVILRDRANADPAVGDVREAFVRHLVERFRLTGATVTNRGPLILDVPVGRRAGVRRAVDRAGSGLGRVVVRVE